MRRLLAMLLWGAGSLQAFAASQITAAQLESIVAAVGHKPDAEAAREIADLELTERLRSAEFSRCIADLPGPHAREALLAVADMSAFLDPPAAAIPNLAEPDTATQRRIMELAVNYVNLTMHNLPNLFATRVTTTFGRDLWSKKPLHAAGRYQARVLYRDGKETEHSIGHGGQERMLTTSGEFGPILGTALLDAAQGNLIWVRWEQGMAGAEAVFRYAVNAKESHYRVENEPTAYHGEIAIDPSNGTIERIVLRADPDAGAPLSTADIVVEYGPVELGGKTYICPLKGVALSSGSQNFWLNDVAFEQYHLFRSSMRILPESDPVR